MRRGGGGVVILYIAGPMTGYPEHNYPAFHDAADRLRASGHHVLNPAAPLVSEVLPEPESVSWEWWMRRALRMLLDAEGVALLPGWQVSRGARIEHRTAVELGMQRRRVTEWVAS